MEFIVDDETGEFYFLEVNTRLQVGRAQRCAAAALACCPACCPACRGPAGLCVTAAAPNRESWPPSLARQVEHGITEMITGVDLVAWQFQLQVRRKGPFTA